MSPEAAPAAPAVDPPEPPQGLWRTTLAGPGRCLTDAFDNVERSPQVERIVRHPTRDLLSARVTLRPEEGKGYWELTRIRNDLFVLVADFAYKNPRFEIVPGDGLVQFNFKVSGDMTYAISSPGPLRFNRPGLHVWRQPKGVDMSEWTAPSAHERTVGISVRPEFLREHFLASSPEVPARLRAFVSPEEGDVGFCLVPLTTQMIELTHKLLDNPYPGVLGLTYAEALTLELLCVAVGHFTSLPQQPTEAYSERQLRALEAAREMLMKQFSPPPTVARLARRVGMSEKALARGFKAVYGETIFDFGLRCRMQRALVLLRDEGLPVDRVSEASGYSHPTSFATAFRRHFGMRPIDVRRPKGAARRNS